jgi:hypothetical protein
VRLLWSIVKIIAYAIDDFICWVFDPLSRRKKARDRLSPRMKQQVNIAIFRMRGRGRF